MNVWTWTHFIQRQGAGASCIGIDKISYVWLGSLDLTSKVSKNNGEGILFRTHSSGHGHGLMRTLKNTYYLIISKVPMETILNNNSLYLAGVNV